jgi:hypothetical protein
MRTPVTDEGAWEVTWSRIYHLRSSDPTNRYDCGHSIVRTSFRDKIAASKRKGLWVGGPIPLGYATANKKLVIVPEEAETVRTMYVPALPRNAARSGPSPRNSPAETSRRRSVPSRAAAPGAAPVYLNRRLLGESWSTAVQPISFIPLSISARISPSARSTPA